MTAPKEPMTTKEALVRVEEYVTLAHEWLDDEEFKEDLAAVNLIKAALEDYERFLPIIKLLDRPIGNRVTTWYEVQEELQKIRAAGKEQHG